MTVQRLRRTVLMLVASMALAALLLLGAAPSYGHAVLLGTDPAEGEVLPASPAGVVLTFNESVQASEGIRLLDATGEPLPTESRSVDDTVEIDVPDDLDDGTYILDWRVISADGHPVSGAFTFSVGAPSDVVVDVVPDSASTVVEVLRQVNQTLVYVGMLGATGLTLFVLVLLDEGAVAAVRSRLHRLAVVLGGVALVGLLLSVPVDGARRAGAGPSSLVDTGLLGGSLMSATGMAAALGIAGLAVALALTPRATDNGRGSWPRVLAYGGALLALASLTLTGHTRTFGPAWLVVGSDVLHVLAGSAWFGGILGLLVVLRSSPVTAASAARTVTRFSAVAAWVVLALAVTGTVLAWRILPGLGALATTGYGITLLAKITVVACIVAVAAWNRFRLLPRISRAGGEPAEWSRLRRSVAAEAGLLVAVLTVTGVLVSQNPTVAEEASTDQAGPVSHREWLGQGIIDVHVSPAAVGENTIELVLTHVGSVPLVPLADPEVRLSLPDAEVGPLVAAVAETGPGTYVVTVNIPLAGDWELEVGARTTTYEYPVVVLPVRVS